MGSQEAKDTVLTSVVQTTGQRLAAKVNGSQEERKLLALLFLSTPLLPPALPRPDSPVSLIDMIFHLYSI